MIKTFITDAVISKGFNDAPALRFNEAKTSVQFKIGKRVYDKNAKDNHRYINIAVKAFSHNCERVDKMQLKEGSRINIIGRLDEEQWEDNGQKYSRFVIIAEEIEYASSEGGNKSNGNGANGSGSAAPPQNGNGTPPQTPNNAQPQGQGGQNGNPSGFTGYDSFGDGNVFFPGGN